MKKIGKKTAFIDSNNFIPDINKKSNFFSQDLIRYFSNNIWTKYNNNVVNASNYFQNEDFKIEHINEDTLLLHANKNVFSSNIIDDRGFLVKSFNKNLWEDYVLNTLTPAYEKNYEDYYIETPDMVDVKDQSMVIEKGSNYSKKEFIYNFFIPKYEELISDSVSDINSFPAYFALGDDPGSGQRKYEENLMLGLGGIISTTYIDGLFAAKNIDNAKVYFNKFSDVYKDNSSIEGMQFIKAYNKNVKINKNKIDYFKSNPFVPFPMYMELTFTNFIDTQDNFYYNIKNIGKVSSDLDTFLIKNDINTDTKKVQNFINTKALEEEAINIYDVKKWLQAGADGTLTTNGTANASDMSRSEQTILSIEYSKLVEYIKKFIKPKARSYMDMLLKPSHSEILFYKIEKRQGGYNKNNILQTFYVEPIKDELIKIIDTQLKYGVEYYYTIKAYTLVVGNSYTYEKYDYSGNMSLYDKDISEGRIRVKVKNKPNYKIFEMPYGKFFGSVQEFPLTKPRPKIEKYEDKLKISLMDSDLESSEQFEVINTNEFNLFEKIALSQDNREMDKIVSKRNKDSYYYLEIFKTVEKPLSYLNFQGKL